MAKKSKKQTEVESRKISGRAQRRIAEEEARKKRIYWIVGGLAAAVLVVALAFVVRERTQDEPLPDIVAGPDTNISAPVDGRVAGDPEASVAVVEWGDYQ